MPVRIRRLAGFRLRKNSDQRAVKNARIKQVRPQENEYQNLEISARLTKGLQVRAEELERREINVTSIVV